MSLFAKKMPLGSPTRSDTQIISMPFAGQVPKPGDIVKLNDGKVEVTTTDTDTAYGVVTFYDNKDVCAVVTSGHVLAKLNGKTSGDITFNTLHVVRDFEAVDEAGRDADATEVKVV